MKIARLLVLTLVGGSTLLTTSCSAPARAPSTHVIRYFRVSPQGKALECTFAVLRGAEGWTITSVTGNMKVEARYDGSDRLLDAQASLQNGATARVDVVGGRAKVTVPGREDRELDVAAGVIVTSAPDWTDTFRICRRWNREQGGKQTFPGLWIHPVQPIQQLTFSAEFVRRDGDLDVITIRLRNNSPYRAWVDPKGRMIKLAALPVKEGSVVLVLDGAQSAAAGLPPE